MTTEDNKKQGKKNKQAGARFELKVRKDLENRGLVVSKWFNNVDLETEELIPAKHKFRGIGIPMSIGTGFPDFIVFNKCDSETLTSVITGMEVKSKGSLDKIEREKCKWLLENNIFNNITIASKGDKLGEIVYKKFEVKEDDRI